VSVESGGGMTPPLLPEKERLGEGYMMRYARFHREFEGGRLSSVKTEREGWISQ